MVFYSYFSITKIDTTIQIIKLLPNIFLRLQCKPLHFMAAKQWRLAQSFLHFLVGVIVHEWSKNTNFVD